MSHLPIVIGGAGLPSAALTDALSAADRLAGEDLAPNTRRAYESDWRDFAAWCRQAGVSALPAAPESVAAYLAHLHARGLSASTIGRRTSAIGWGHRRKDLLLPTSAAYVRRVGRGIRRTIGTAPARKAPATLKIVKGMLACLPDTLAGKRDRALITWGFAAALRRSELVGRTVADLERVPEGIILNIGRSKTDQEGAGQSVAVPHGDKLRPVAVLDAWLEAAGIVEGPLFRAIAKGGRVGATALSDRSASEIVKRWAGASGIDPDDFAGHSLRAGAVTEMLSRGADLFKVMDVTRHRSVQTLRGYDRRSKLFRGHAARGFL